MSSLFLYATPKKINPEDKDSSLYIYNTLKKVTPDDKDSSLYIYSTPKKTTPEDKDSNLYLYNEVTEKTPEDLNSDLFLYSVPMKKTPEDKDSSLYIYNVPKYKMPEDDSSDLYLYNIPKYKMPEDDGSGLYLYNEVTENPNFTSMDLFEDFEDENYVFTFEGDWIRTTTTPYAGSYCYTNKDIIDGQSSSFQTMVRTEGGTISFWYRTSTETNLDKLRFYVDDTYVLTASGATSWTQFTYDLQAGQHTLKWEYTKDGSVSSGEDSVYIDNLLVGGVMVWGLGRRIAFFF